MEARTLVRTRIRARLPISLSCPSAWAQEESYHSRSSVPLFPTGPPSISAAQQSCLLFGLLHLLGMIKIPVISFKIIRFFFFLQWTCLWIKKGTSIQVLSWPPFTTSPVPSLVCLTWSVLSLPEKLTTIFTVQILLKISVPWHINLSRKIRRRYFPLICI